LTGVGRALDQPGREHRLDALLGPADLDHPPQPLDAVGQGLPAAPHFAHPPTASASHQGPSERFSLSSASTWATTAAARGRNLASSSEAKGTGTSGVVTRTGGAARSPNISSTTAATMSAPQPPLRGLSSTITSRPVVATESKTV